MKAIIDRFEDNNLAVLVVENVALASIAWKLINRNGKHIAWLIV